MITIHAKSPEGLPMLTQEYRGSTAIINKGCFQDMYTFLWHEQRRGDEIIEYGQWKFMIAVPKELLTTGENQ